MPSAEAPIPEAGPEQSRVQVSVYSRFKPLQKRGITAIAAFCGFLAQMSTTSVNAVYLAFMGLSAFVWGPSIRLQGLRLVDKFIKLWGWSNPSRVVKVYGNKNLLLVFFASSALVWNMSSLLTPIRYVLNPRFHLTTPLQSGLLYLVPGAGYLAGSQLGGRWSDYTVNSWIQKGGIRLPEDRLRSSLIFLALILPGSMILYGWTLDKKVGGIPLPVVCMYFQGVAQTGAFPSLNTYILDEVQNSNSGEASGMSLTPVL
ncbi:MFS antiporter QDR3-like protein 1 [Colletotrichum sojae]|uniref:MFS antiporter QDR3-like protein 1 n=1 Tax=Colletotrichum sojae TaxID=2175907 RepID=A0A8H6IUB2_9PEZI|nr:MFS antiporter QDR3-like protein 1 [Colletotrichum sojae]